MSRSDCLPDAGLSELREWPLEVETQTFDSGAPGSCTGFLIRSNIEWKALRVNKAFSKPGIAVLKSSWWIGKAGPYLEWTAISVRTVSPSMMEEVQCHQPAIKWGQWPGTMGHDAILGSQCSFLLLIGRALCSNGSQVRLSEGQLNTWALWASIA